MPIPNTMSQQPSPNLFALGNTGLVQSKNSAVFSNALSSPVRRSLQPFHLEQGGDAGYFANGVNRDQNSTASNDSSMDMHSDSPAHDSYWVVCPLCGAGRATLPVEQNVCLCYHSSCRTIQFNPPPLASNDAKLVFCCCQSPVTSTDYIAKIL